MAVSFNGKHLAKFIRPEEYEAIYPQVELAHNQLESKTGAGNDFLGWLTATTVCSEVRTTLWCPRPGTPKRALKSAKNWEKPWAFIESAVWMWIPTIGWWRFYLS